MTLEESTNESPGSKLGSSAKRRLTWAVVSLVFLSIVAVGGWFGLERIEKQTRKNVGESLTVVVGTIHDSLREWYSNERDFARRMASRPLVIKATQELLAIQGTPEELLKHEAFQELRTYFTNRDSSQGKLGIFLIAPDERNLFSMRDTNVGLRNLIAEQRPERLQKAFEGVASLIPPLESDVPLGQGDQPLSRGVPTMFLAVPVKSPEGKVIAVLTVRLDPADDFTRIFRTGRIGSSGESYALDQNGWMLSESRFDDELASLGLMEPDGLSMLGIRITDPLGSSEQKGLTITLSGEEPLTLMATQVRKSKSGRNTEGYRDYRGVKVLGAWEWDPDLSIGFASEIDEYEALAVFRITRTIVLMILGLTVVLAFFLAAYLVKLGERIESEQRLAEEKAVVESAASAKTEFLAHMSHEIRTPLNAIIGFSQLLRRDDSLDDDTLRTVQIIERSGNHLLLLINDVLEMSKIEAGQLTLNRESVCLRNIAEDMREMMGLKASQKGLKFELNWDESLPDYVDIDSGKFRQIVLNLLSNAIKFTESGTVSLSGILADDSEIASDISLRIEVTDTGTGISKEDQEKLFGAFYQSDTGRRQQGGTGLGLAISAKFAAFLGGDLSLTSEVGKGSTFILRLPLEVSSNLKASAAKHSEIHGSGLDIIGLELGEGENPPRILIAEDQPANRELMERLLGDIGFDLRFAEDGRQAIEQVDEWDPEFIWMDLKMPEMNGDEATRRIREKHGDSLPIVALTASALSVERDALMQQGFSEVLMKPINPAEIFFTMKSFLNLTFVTKEDKFASVIENEPSAFGRLEDLPDVLKQKLRGAIDLGDLAGIGACVEEIRGIDAAVAESLEEPLANFDFGSIVAGLGDPD